jgi:hypothetical protein
MFPLNLILRKKEGIGINTSTIPIDVVNHMSGIELIDEKMIRYNDQIIRYNGVNYISGVELINDQMIRYN